MQILTWKRPADTILGSFCVIVMLLLVACVVWQVVSRYVLNDPSTFTNEAARYLMMWVGLLGAAYTVGLQRHLSIDLISGNLSGRTYRFVHLLINLIIMTFTFLVIFKGGIDLVEKVLSRGQVSAVMRIPMGYVYLALPISGTFMMFYSALFVVEHGSHLLRPGNDTPPTEETT